MVMRKERKRRNKRDVIFQGVPKPPQSGLWLFSHGLVIGGYRGTACHV